MIVDEGRHTGLNLLQGKNCIVNTTIPSWRSCDKKTSGSLSVDWVGEISFALYSWLYYFHFFSLKQNKTDKSCIVRYNRTQSRSSHLCSPAESWIMLTSHSMSVYHTRNTAHWEVFPKLCVQGVLRCWWL